MSYGPPYEQVGPNIQSLKQAAYDQVGPQIHQRGHWTPADLVPKPFWSIALGWPAAPMHKAFPQPSHPQHKYIRCSLQPERRQKTNYAHYKIQAVLPKLLLSMTLIFFTQFPWWSSLCAKVLSQFFQWHCELCVSLLSSLQHQSFHVSGILPYILT